MTTTTNDLSQFKKGDIILNSITKKLMIVLQSEPLNIHRVKLMNLSDAKEEVLEAPVGKPICMVYHSNKAPYIFKEISFDFAKDYLLDDRQEIVIKNILENLDARGKFQDTPYEKILKTTDIN